MHNQDEFPFGELTPPSIKGMPVYRDRHEPRFEELPAEKASRLRQARVILERPDRFLMCEGCGNLFRKGGRVESTGLCWICHGYRLNFDGHAIVGQACEVMDHPRSSVLPCDYH